MSGAVVVGPRRGGGGGRGGAEHRGVPAVGVGRPGEAGQVRAAARGGVPDSELAVRWRVAAGVSAQECAAVVGVERRAERKRRAGRAAALGVGLLNSGGRRGRRAEGEETKQRDDGDGLGPGEEGEGWGSW